MSLKSMQILNETMIISPLEGLGVMRPSTASHAKKEIATTLTLTSLVDCFTTILAYLLLATSFGGESMDIPKNMALPHAYHSTTLEGGLVVMVENGRYFLGKTPIAVDRLAEVLKAEKERTHTPYVVIQADKKTSFAQINPAVLSGLQAGFEQVRFAVLQEDET
jgi:biopolymer transport protein ExbD